MATTETTTPKKAPELKEVVRINPFCKAPKYHFDKCDDPFVSRVKTVEIKDKDTVLVEPVFEDVDLMSEVRAAASLAGVDYMKRLLASGQARPEDFFDDGQHAVDMSLIPATPHDAAKAAEAGQEQFKQLAKELGIPEGEHVSGQVLEKYLSDLVAKKFNEMQSQKKEGE